MVDIKMKCKYKQWNAIDFFVLLSVLFELLFCLLQLFLVQEYMNFFLFVNSYILIFLVLIDIVVMGINKHFIIFAYFACFFVFLMGQKFFSFFDTGIYNGFYTFIGLYLSNSQYFIFSCLIYFSIIMTFVFYKGLTIKHTIALSLFRPQDIKSVKPIEDIRRKRVRKVSRIMTYVTAVFAFTMQLMIVFAKKDVSYEAGYLMNINVPTIVRIFNYMFAGSVFLFLSTIPRKREVWFVLAMYVLIEGGLQLFIGRRALIASTALLTIWYLIQYYRLNSKRMPLRYLLYIFAGGCAIIVVFWFIEQLRGGAGFESRGLFSIIESFFRSTGGSDSVIANTINKMDEFPKPGVVYLFSPLYYAVTDNPVMRVLLSLFGVPAQSYPQGMDYLNNYDSFSAWLSYIVSPDYYLAGHGMGSSFIAEWYLAFGIIGVVFVSAIVGLLIARFNRTDFHRGNVYINATIMFFVSYLFTLPRDSTFAFATYFLYFIFSMLICKIFSS